MTKLYVIQNEEGFYKIGYSKSVDDRIKQLQTGTHSNFTKIFEFETNNGSKLEAWFHNIFKYRRIRREFYDLDDENINYIKDNCKSIDRSFEILKSSGNPFI